MYDESLTLISKGHCFVHTNVNKDSVVDSKDWTDSFHFTVPVLVKFNVDQSRLGFEDCFDGGQPI